MLSASVICPSGAIADALATALFVMGVEAARQFCEQQPQIAAILVHLDSKSGKQQIELCNIHEDVWLPNSRSQGLRHKAMSYKPISYKPDHPTPYPLLPLTPYPLPLTPYPLPLTPYPLPLTPYPLPLTPYPLPLTPYSLLLTLPGEFDEKEHDSIVLAELVHGA